MNGIEKRIVRLFAVIKYRHYCKIERDAIVYGDCHFEGKNKLVQRHMRYLLTWDSQAI